MVQLFRGRGDPNPKQRLERELLALEEQIRSASPGYETQFLNRAATLCVEAEQPSRALGYFGRAIDAYLEAGRFGAAEVLCNRVLQISPDAVRARCTLAWLSMGKGSHAGPAREIADYVGAAKKAGKEALAVKQLSMMAAATSSQELRELLAGHLLDLGEEQQADRIFGEVFAERNGLRAPSVQDEAKLWAELLRAALMSPEELKDAVGRSRDDGDSFLQALIERDRDAGEGE